MDNPFIFGEAVSGPAFWNREKEVTELSRDLRQGVNVIVFSARRHGKTSLIKTVLAKLKKDGLITVYVDLYPATSKEAFINIYAKAVAHSLGNPTSKILGIVRKWLPRFLPKLVIDSKGALQLSFDFTNDRLYREGFKDLLESVHRRATEEKRNAVVVFDEFQEVSAFGDDQIERDMRTVFQTHRNVSYVFMGSKKHLFHGIFNDANRPFYRSGKHFPLGRLPAEEIVKYASEKFKGGGIRIDKQTAALIPIKSRGHPYYTQLLCHILWEIGISKKRLISTDVDSAVDQMLNQESASYEAVMDSLTPRMRSLALALCNEETKSIFTERFTKRHHLVSASHIQRSLGALIQKDVIESVEGRYLFQDPFFALWLQRIETL